METARLLPSSSSSSPTNLTTPTFLLPTHTLSKTHHSHRPFSSSSTMSSPTMAETPQLHTASVTKRNLALSLILGFSSSAISLVCFTPTPVLASEDELIMGLKRYTDEKEGFTLLIPSSWIKIEKAGATVLFEEPNKGINNVGVVVSPVRLNSLEEFGTPQFVVDKLIQAEKRKESTKDAEVIGVAERSGHGGLQVYEFEYSLDSTRGGVKRIFSAAFVASKKLYLLNIAYSDKPETPLDTSMKMMLEQVLHSFDTSSMSI